MTNLERVKKLIEHFKKLALMQKKELVDTKAMPNYNASFTKLLILKKQLSDRCGLFKHREPLSLHTFDEMATELPKMIDPAQLEDAQKIYTDILNELLKIKPEPSETAIPALESIEPPLC